jgi:hypothetical protein
MTGRVLGAWFYGQVSSEADLPRTNFFFGLGEKSSQVQQLLQKKAAPKNCPFI